mmetsp:Transcript_39887/g.127547  ORF Transcript_39887/g.127547 Transcript_39887/m.127547 type:complete len:298 (+) Transcript_39887:632-1525(+)
MPNHVDVALPMQASPSHDARRSWLRDVRPFLNARRALESADIGGDGGDGGGDGGGGVGGGGGGGDGVEGAGGDSIEVHPPGPTYEIVWTSKLPTPQPSSRAAVTPVRESDTTRLDEECRHVMSYSFRNKYVFTPTAESHMCESECTVTPSAWMIKYSLSTAPKKKTARRIRIISCAGSAVGAVHVIEVPRKICPRYPTVLYAFPATANSANGTNPDVAPNAVVLQPVLSSVGTVLVATFDKKFLVGRPSKSWRAAVARHGTSAGVSWPQSAAVEVPISRAAIPMADALVEPACGCVP